MRHLEDYGSSVASQQGANVVALRAAPLVGLLVANLFEKAKALNIVRVQPLAQLPDLTPARLGSACRRGRLVSWLNQVRARGLCPLDRL